MSTLHIGIDPGYSGAICLLGDKPEFRPMPLIGDSKNRDYDLQEIRCFARDLTYGSCVAIEAFASFALGAKQAQSLVRCVTAFECACTGGVVPLRIVKSQTWQKVAFEGTQADLKPKARARIAASRIFGSESEKWTEGQRDAALIAWWSQRA